MQNTFRRLHLLAQRTVSHILAQVSDGHSPPYTGKSRITFAAPASEAYGSSIDTSLFHDDSFLFRASKDSAKQSKCQAKVCFSFQMVDDPSYRNILLFLRHVVVAPAKDVRREADSLTTFNCKKTD